MRRGTSLFLAGAALLLGITAAAAQDKPIKLGAVLATQGGPAFLGDPEAKVLRLYVEKINAAGGVNGRKIDLVLYETNGAAADAANFAKRLTSQDNVDFIIGGSTTGETMAMVPEIERAGVPFISLGGASVIVEPVKKWVFKVPQTDRSAVEKVYIDIKQRAMSKIGLIAGSGGFDKSCTDNARALAKTHNLTIVADETHGAADSDMTPQLTKIKNANADAVLYCGFGAAAVVVTKNYQQLGIKAAFYHNHGSASSQWIKGSGKAAESVRLPAEPVLVAKLLADRDKQKAPGIAFAEAYKAKYNEDPSTFAGYAHDALLLMQDAIKRAGGTDKAKVRDALEKTKDLVGVTGIFTMSEKDHNGVDARSFRMIEVKNGTWRLLY
jgi:branched-chain amino acid transport system substrate-binding protein